MGNSRKKSRLKDRQIGANIRQMRITAGLSQKDVAEHLCVTYQQVQKYEHGETRLSAAMLHELAGLYKTPCGRFFDGLDRSGKDKTATPAPIFHDDATLKIIATLSGVSDPALKVKIRKIVEVLAG